MKEIRLNPTCQQDLYEQACRDMAAWMPGWEDTYPSDPAVAVLEHLTWLSDLENSLLDQVEDAHYRGYLALLGAELCQRKPARLKARGQADCRPGQRFYLGELPFEVTGSAGDTVALAQQESHSAMVQLDPPFRLPEHWAGQRVLYCFAPAGDGWRRLETVRVEEGCLTGWAGPGPETIRVAAAEPDFAALRRLDGVAMEEVELDLPGIQASSLQVMVEEKGIWRDCPVDPPDAGQTLPLGCRWDGERHRLRFGDGADFEPPEPGQLLICSCISTRGAAANGACGRLTGPGGQTLESLTAAAGGADEETPREAFLRAVAEQSQPLRAVTCRDYEVLAGKTPGLALARVRALPRAALGETGPGVVVLAVPRTRRRDPVLTRRQQEHLAGWLEPHRLLGVPLEVRSPLYGPLAVRVTVAAGDDFDPKALYRAALALTDGVEGALDFGADISYTALYAALGRVPGVQAVRRLELEALGPGLRLAPDGSLLPEAGVLPRLTEWKCSTS